MKKTVTICDRCGCQYNPLTSSVVDTRIEENISAHDVQIKFQFIRSYATPGSSNRVRETYDLCSNCAAGFSAWMRTGKLQ